MDRKTFRRLIIKPLNRQRANPGGWIDALVTLSNISESRDAWRSIE